jgi:hypothetical protein
LPPPKESLSIRTVLVTMQLPHHLQALSPRPLLSIAICAITCSIAIVVINALRQLLPRKKSEPPLVFHWIPFVGNAVSYGLDPFAFYTRCREKVRAGLV